MLRTASSVTRAFQPARRLYRAPRIAAAASFPRSTARDLGLAAQVSRPGVEVYVVVEPGIHAGRWFEAGDVLVCEGEPEADDPIVLVARGFGRPRLGSWAGGRLVGDAGEPCHPERWRSAGRLVSRVAGRGHPWVAELVESAQRADAGVGIPSGRAAAGGRGGRSPAAQLSPQLSLFAGAGDRQGIERRTRLRAR